MKKRKNRITPDGFGDFVSFFILGILIIVCLVGTVLIAHVYFS